MVATCSDTALRKLCAEHIFEFGALVDLHSTEAWTVRSRAARPLSLMACQAKGPQIAGRYAVPGGKVHAQIGGQIAWKQSADVPACYRQTTLKPAVEENESTMCSQRPRTRGKT